MPFLTLLVWSLPFVFVCIINHGRQDFALILLKYENFTFDQIKFRIQTMYKVLPFCDLCTKPEN